MRVGDISNYDYDHDINNPGGWVAEYRAAGVEGVIIGSQWPQKARWQLDQCRAGELPVIATYAEPNVTTAIALAQEAGCSIVAIVIEPGGIEDLSRLRYAIQAVRDAGMTPKIYGNRGDVLGLIGGNSIEFQDVELWVASYFGDGHVIDSVPWWRKVWAHQFTSTMLIAGRNRDMNEVFGEVGNGMTDNDILAVFGSTEADPAERLANAKYRYQQSIDTGHSPFDLASQVQSDIRDHIKNHAAGITGMVQDHTHEGGKVKR